MKKILSCLLCVVLVTSCNNEDIEQMSENTSESSELKAAVHPLDRSLTVPLWEYESLNAPYGYRDYYYMNAPTASLNITIKGVVYKRIRQVDRIFKEALGSNYQGMGAPVTRWYSPSTKRHRMRLGTTYSSCYYWETVCDDYIYDGTVGYISIHDRDQYFKPGMLEYHEEFYYITVI